MSKINHKTATPDTRSFNTLMYPKGNYGRIGIDHIKRGIHGVPGTVPGYRLYGVHGTTNRFPANPEWTKWLHEHAHFIARTKHWFLPCQAVDDIVMQELKQMLEDSIQEWKEVMRLRRDRYFDARREERKREELELEEEAKP